MKKSNRIWGRWGQPCLHPIYPANRDYKAKRAAIAMALRAAYLYGRYQGNHPQPKE